MKKYSVKGYVVYYDNWIVEADSGEEAIEKMEKQVSELPNHVWLDKSSYELLSDNIEEYQATLQQDEIRYNSKHLK